MENARQVAERAVEAWNKRDLDTFMALASPGIKMLAPGGIDRTGFEGWAEHYAVWNTAFPDNVITPEAIVTEGERVMGEGIFAGTHRGVLRGPDGDVPPTGKQIRAPFVLALQVVGGKIVSHRIYYDRAELMAQLGLLPAAASR